MKIILIIFGVIVVIDLIGMLSMFIWDKIDKKEYKNEIEKYIGRKLKREEKKYIFNLKKEISEIKFETSKKERSKEYYEREVTMAVVEADPLYALEHGVKEGEYKERLLNQDRAIRKRNYNIYEIDEGNRKIREKEWLLKFHIDSMKYDNTKRKDTKK